MENSTKSWYENLINECNNLAESFGLDDLHMSEMREFVTRIAKEQYKSGSKSGYWFAKKGGEKAAAAPAAVAA
jgi:hypothetical protein